MNRHPWWRLRGRGGAILCSIIVLSASYPLSAQIGLGRRPRGDRGIGSGGDPTDPDKQREAKIKKAGKYYEAGMKLLAKDRVRPAKSKFKSVIELVGLEGRGQAALSQLLKLHTDGMQHLNQAAAHAENGKYREALKLAKETKVRYANLLRGVPGTSHLPNISQAAVRLIKNIERDPQAREALQEYEAAKRFKRIARLERKAKKDPTKHYDIYKICLTIAKRFPDCPTGRECIKRLEDLKADRKLYKLVKKEEKRRFIAAALQRADQYERNGLHKQAQAERKKLAEKFPGRTIAELRRMAKKKN